jgi:hypothetical protein
LRFEDEQYVRLYKRDTTTWKMLPWQAKCILPLILRKMDRAGILDLGEDGLDALAVHIEIPREVVDAAMPEILKRRVLVLRDDGLLVWPRFIEGQEAKQSDKARQKAARDRARDVASAIAVGVAGADTPQSPPSEPPPTPPSQNDQPCDATVTPRDQPSRTVTAPSHDVTAGHTTSPGVTLSSAEPSSAQPIATDGAEGWRVPESEVRLHGSLWVDEYKRAVLKATGMPAWSFPPKQMAALERVVSDHCPSGRRARIENWVFEIVGLFVVATRSEAKFQSGWVPEALERWLNKGGAASGTFVAATTTNRPPLLRRPEVNRNAVPPIRLDVLDVKPEVGT